MESALRKEDVRLADLISEFLDKHFYPKYVTNFERVTDKKRQCEGIDVIFDINGSHYLCDEKNGGSRINTNLRTFSLELSFIDRSGIRRTGWLMNEHNINDSYLFIWTDKADSVKPVSVDEIHRVEVALVKKNKIKEYLRNVAGLDDTSIRTMDECIVNRPHEMGHALISENSGKRKYSISGVTVCHSTQLYEQPLNIILPREVYRKIADLNVVITA
jgi:hypothetical protein